MKIKQHRRTRRHPRIRELIAETSVSRDKLILPLFIKEGVSEKKEICSMPGVFQHSIESALHEIEAAVKAGVTKFIFFGIPASKDSSASSAFSRKGIVQQALKAAGLRFPDILKIADTCLCEYTDHGHCGHLVAGEIDNSSSVDTLSKIALSLAESGADIIAPSDMMDGRVSVIRHTLDRQGLENTPIMSYSAKYKSSLYAPFRDAAENAPSAGDRSAYQMDIRNRKEALSEIESDIEEGADLILLKPASMSADILSDAVQFVSQPIGVYQVSGEYAMIKAAAAKGWINEEEMIREQFTFYMRAGASFIVSYFAHQFAESFH